MMAFFNDLPKAGMKNLCLLLTLMLILYNAKGNIYQIKFSPDTLIDGDTITATVYLGTEEEPAQDVTSFEYNLGPACGDTVLRVISTTVHTSFLTEDGMYITDESLFNCSFNHLFERTGPAVSGHGPIADHIIVIDILDGGREKYTGLEPATTPLALSVYPNPASGSLHYHVGGQKITELALLDKTGRIIWADPAPTSGSGQIDLSGVDPEVYWLQLKVDCGIVTRKVVVQ